METTLDQGIRTTMKAEREKALEEVVNPPVPAVEEMN
jgi:hypothetical protein